MAMPNWVPEYWAKLNDENKKQADNFIKQLYLKQEGGEVPPVKPFQFDILKGQIEIEDNFDDPLPCFKEYM